MISKIFVRDQGLQKQPLPSLRFQDSFVARTARKPQAEPKPRTCARAFAKDEGQIAFLKPHLSCAEDRGRFLAIQCDYLRKLAFSTASLFVIFGFSFGWALGLPHGYLDDVSSEKDEKNDELVVITNPKPLNKEKPFLTRNLSIEFETQYEQRFGRTEVERNLLPSRFDQYFYNGLYVSYEEDLARKKSFGEYMIRRVIEYHADAFFKESDQLRPVYEAKDKLSNIDVQVKQGYKINFRYNLSGNYLDAIFDNPYNVDFKMSYYLGSGEMITTLKYNLTDHVSVFADYRLISSVVRLTLSRAFTKALSANIQGTSYTAGTEGAETIDGYIRQNVVLVGLTYRN